MPLLQVTHFACKAEDAVEGIHELAGDAGIDLLVSGGREGELVSCSVRRMDGLHGVFKAVWLFAGGRQELACRFTISPASLSSRPLTWLPRREPAPRAGGRPAPPPAAAAAPGSRRDPHVQVPRLWSQQVGQSTCFGGWPLQAEVSAAALHAYAPAQALPAFPQSFPTPAAALDHGCRGEECLQQLIKDLGPGFERHAMLWLLANTQHEQTCVAWKAAEPPAPSGAAAAGGGAGGATA